jgi:hypothetical protein
MTQRVRVGLLAVIVLVALVGAGGYVLYAKHRQDAAGTVATVQSTGDVAAVSAGPHLAFRSTALGPDYGRLALVPLADPAGPRAYAGGTCDRVYAVRTGAVCLHADRKLVTTYTARLLDAGWSTGRELPLTGVPSRTRLSPDGSLVATTTFVSGDSYANPGRFSTRTVVTPAGAAGVDLEEFRLVIDGTAVLAADLNLWGVTFADDDVFYATAATGGRTWLVRGSLRERQLTAVHADVECPSLSPDGTRVAYKKHGDLPPGQWRLTLLDLATGKETPLGETRSVDDQAEWLDDGHVIYGLPRAGSAVATSDVWVVAADGTGRPRVLVPDAWSPAVVR